MTPQVGCSWVSFETNAKLDTVVTLVQSVLTIFQPGRAAVSIMANKVRPVIIHMCTRYIFFLTSLGSQWCIEKFCSLEGEVQVLQLPDSVDKWLQNNLHPIAVQEGHEQ